MHQIVCEHLEATDRETDAIECFHEMMTKLGGEAYASGLVAEWVSGEFMFYLSAVHLIFCQISPTDVSLLPAPTHRRLAPPSIRGLPHHS